MLKITRYPKAIKILDEGLENSLQFYEFQEIDHRKISSTNMLERLNRKIRRRTKVVSVFPSMDSYIRLVSCYSIEYAKIDLGQGVILIKELRIASGKIARRLNSFWAPTQIANFI